MDVQEYIAFIIFYGSLKHYDIFKSHTPYYLSVQVVRDKTSLLEYIPSLIISMYVTHTYETN